VDLNEIAIFVAVVEAGGFTAAARRLGLPKSTVSTRVARLEHRLGVRLLQRTTRSLGLTDVGAAFHQRCARIVADAEEAERAITACNEAPRGLLRLTAPVDITAAYLGGPLAEFCRRYPDIAVELVSTDRVVDLVDEGFDVALRAGRLTQTTLMARRLAQVGSQLFASPAYLARHGRPRAPADLAGHACLVFSSPPEPRRWRLRDPDGREVAVQVSGPLTVNSPDAIRRAMVAGLGIALLPVFAGNVLAGAIAPRGDEIEQVLPGWSGPESVLSVVYPSPRYLSPKVRAFVDFIVDHFADPAWPHAPA